MDFSEHSPEAKLEIGYRLIAEANDEIHQRSLQTIKDFREAQKYGDEWLTILQVAEILKVSQSWVRTRMKRKKNPIPHLDDGITRISRDRLNAWIYAEPEEKLNIEYIGEGENAPLRSVRLRG